MMRRLKEVFQGVCYVLTVFAHGGETEVADSRLERKLLREMDQNRGE